MNVLRGLQQLSTLNRPTAVTIGNFDGVHLGHQALLRTLRVQADRQGLPVVVVLFEPHPSEYFLKQEAPARLYRFRDKLTALRRLGVDYVCCLTFNAQLALMPARTFAEHLIFSLLKARYVLVGDDFRFGFQREGDVALLSRLSTAYACEVVPFSDVKMKTSRVSSTCIRQALQSGDFDRATRLLGRPYHMSGRVMRGDGRAGLWGIPTANISLRRQRVPLAGVFCVRVLRQGRVWCSGVANVGCRPTVNGHKQVLEIHLFDLNESLYGELLEVYFLHKLRDEVKFASVDALIARIHQDVATAKHWFKTTTHHIDLMDHNEMRVSP